MYIEATKKNAGDNAKLKLYLNGNGEVSCLRFYYHMYGDTIGALNVYSENHLIFNSIGNHGNFWIKAERTFHSDTIVSCCKTETYFYNKIASIMTILTPIVMGKYDFHRKNPMNRKHTPTKIHQQ